MEGAGHEGSEQERGSGGGEDVEGELAGSGGFDDDGSVGLAVAEPGDPADDLDDEEVELGEGVGVEVCAEEDEAEERDHGHADGEVPDAAAGEENDVGDAEEVADGFGGVREDFGLEGVEDGLGDGHG